MTDPSRRLVLPPYVPFWQRVFLLPVRPSFWLHATARSLGSVIVALLVLAFLANLFLGIHRGVQFRSFLYEAADTWDAKYDPIVYENGRLRVLGDRIVRVQDARQTLLVDPEETVSLGSIRTPEFLVFRSTEVVRKQAFGSMERVPLAELEELFGSGPIVLDSTHLRSLVSKWVLPLQVGIALLLAFFGPLFDILGCLAYSLPAAGIVMLLRGSGSGMPFGATYRVAVAASSATIVLDLFLSLLGSSPPILLGAPMWIVLILGFTLAATLQLPGESADPDRGPQGDLPAPPVGEPSASPPFPS